MPSLNIVVKHSGQVFTPAYLVKNILDFASYSGDIILDKHVIDNSCGDGAFLIEIVDRYCHQYLSARGANIEGLKRELEQYIHGIELDEEAYRNCLCNLDHAAAQYGVSGVRWDMLNQDALTVSQFDGQMDFVVGNPPYVRVHNLEDSYNAVKCYSFAQDGMTDLYLVFYELGLRMLKDNGRLCYITPSSWFTSVAATNLRRYIMQRHTLAAIVDLGHYQAFDGITTYTEITLFESGQWHEIVSYYSYSPERHEIVFEGDIPYSDIDIEGNFYLAHQDQLSMLRDIKCGQRNKVCEVKNGFATLADKVFILDVSFETFTIPVLKASTGQWHKAFFPYDKQGKPLPRDVIFAVPQVAEYLNAHKAELLKGKDETTCPQWYLYGRTQALADVYQNKYAINSLVRDIGSIKLTEAPCGTGLYSGLYILTHLPFKTIERTVKSDDFINYVKVLRKYKSGGYYTFNTKDLEQYLNAKLSLKKHIKTNVNYDERWIFESDIRFL